MQLKRAETNLRNLLRKIAIDEEIDFRIQVLKKEEYLLTNDLVNSQNPNMQQQIQQKKNDIINYMKIQLISETADQDYYFNNFSEE